jgi:hypothetical protein
MSDEAPYIGSAIGVERGSSRLAEPGRTPEDSCACFFHRATEAFTMLEGRISLIVTARSGIVTGGVDRVGLRAYGFMLCLTPNMLTG